VSMTDWLLATVVVPGLVPGIHVLLSLWSNQRRGWPGQARP
jgi:hypothetical protein